MHFRQLPSIDRNAPNFCCALLSEFIYITPPFPHSALNLFQFRITRLKTYFQLFPPIDGNVFEFYCAALYTI